MVTHVVLFFFFQAEDGIRYLVRSRGLGDVYKRQPLQIIASGLTTIASNDLISFLKKYLVAEAVELMVIGMPVNLDAVSYTHLTLPTSDLV